ncbi:MAG: hypothetical protein J6T73_00725, partial [Clostridia bacterium]|nr:hypothetical protein [Clostridia bacterium]
ALFIRTAAALFFAAENIAGSSFTIEQLLLFPLSYLIAVLVITAVITLAYRLVYAFCFYGAVKHVGGAKTVLFTIFAFFSCALASVFLFVASREKFLESKSAKAAE